LLCVISCYSSILHQDVDVSNKHFVFLSVVVVLDILENGTEY